MSVSARATAFTDTSCTLNDCRSSSSASSSNCRTSIARKSDSTTQLPKMTTKMKKNAPGMPSVRRAAYIMRSQSSPVMAWNVVSSADHRLSKFCRGTDAAAKPGEPIWIMTPSGLKWKR